MEHHSFSMKSPRPQRAWPSTRRRRAAMVAAIQLPVLIWLACSYMLARRVFGLELVAALAIACGCAYVIGLVEMCVIRARAHWTMIAARLILTVNIAVLGGAAGDLVIFDGDIAGRVRAVAISRQELVVARTKADWDEALGRLDAELDGTGGSRHRGCGAICTQLQHQADVKRGDYLGARAALDALRAGDSDPQADLAKQSVGLLGRLAALHDLLQANPLARVVWAMLALVVLIMESSVLLVKVAFGHTLEERLEVLREAVVMDTAQRQQRALLATVPWHITAARRTRSDDIEVQDV